MAHASSSTDGFGTRAVHAGSAPSQETGAVIPAISLSTTYAQSKVGVHKGYEYTRAGNPNRDALEELLASILGGGDELSGNRVQFRNTSSLAHPQ